MKKILLRIGVEPTIFFMEQIPFSLKFFSGLFYGQSFIKTSEVLSYSVELSMKKVFITSGLGHLQAMS